MTAYAKKFNEDATMSFRVNNNCFKKIIIKYKKKLKS